MDTAMIARQIILFAAMLCLAACSSLSEKSNSPLAGSTPTILGTTLPGISDLDTESAADKADDAWWSGYYGRK